MPDNDAPIQLTSMSSAFDRMFPTLKPVQIERAAAHGRRRSIQAGEVLVEAGTPNTRVFFVTRGHPEIVRQPGTDEQIDAISFVHRVLQE
jgi:CRP-like cAMP-binding protein